MPDVIYEGYLFHDSGLTVHVTHAQIFSYDNDGKHTLGYPNLNRLVYRIS